MNVAFEDADLARMASDPTFTGGWQPGVAKAFRKWMRYIKNALDERDFYAMKSMHFEKMRSNEIQNSIRINDQYRLIVELRGKGREKVVHVIGITDYH
jgi:proteic killer suppression protein